MKLDDNKLQEILAGLAIQALNPMQQATLKANAEAGDIILLSNTGSGKTLAFLLPVLERIQANSTGTQALIVAPSRELAQQIETVWKNMKTGTKVTLCYGGHRREIEESSLTVAPDLIIGTPGRLADHLRRGNINAASIHTLVLDEYDKCLELGFEEDIKQVIAPLSGLQKRFLVSATPPENLQVALTLETPQRIDFLKDEPENLLELKYLGCRAKDKLEDLFDLLCLAADRAAIVFCNHRESVARTSDFLTEKGITNVYYHGALEQKERELALAKFRNGSVRTLVTTDLAARGLDIPNIRYIIHYHLPQTEESYIHRNGRTARVDKSGTVVLMKAPDEAMPAFVPGNPEPIELPGTPVLPQKPQWVTFRFGV
ncbi:MAG: DEAD/DEAH box helicase, partial [Chitinophagaceae bacterium]|nr:DEAD/DEAH box helicase [Chitinophagaceae bacterium]